MRRTEGELERSETTMIFSKGEERFGDRGKGRLCSVCTKEEFDGTGLAVCALSARILV